MKHTATPPTSTTPKPTPLASLIRLTEIVARIAERIERRAEHERVPDRPAA